MKIIKNKLAVIVIILSVTFLGLIGYSVNRNKVSVVESGIGSIFNPIQGAIYNINSEIKDFLSFVFNFSSIRQENKDLKKENDEFKKNMLEYKNLKAENARLRSMFEFKNKESDYDYVGCDISGKCGNNWISGFLINKGSKDGIANGMIVINSAGLAGQVTSVANTWSKVETLANENIAVSGLVESTREIDGIIRGFKDSDKKVMAKLYYLPLSSKIKKGDVISTSVGVNALYPKGIRIGTVVDIEEDKGKVMKNAIIQPYVDFNKLEEVFVVIPKNKREIKY